MTEPITFASTTPRFNLPNLFVAQAQKEFTINEAMARVDSMLHPSVLGEANDPPAAPADGESWIVGEQPTGDWSSHAGEIATFQSGNWLFIAPPIGTTVFDNSSGATARFDGGWQRATSVAIPTGGATEDTEARAAIAGLISALIGAGVLPSS